MRVLPVSQIPKELWVDEKLHIPKVLNSSFKVQLEQLGELDRATEGKTTEKAFHGGKTDKETVDHFVYRFPASSGRVQYAALSPCNNLVTISDALMSTFASGDVSVLDIPGGTGAAMSSLLLTVATLRASGTIPVLPLTVRITAGDLSPKALEIYCDMLTEANSYLNKNSIVVEFKPVVWDATRTDDTAMIVDEWFEMSTSDSEFMVCISNFTGALIDAKLFDDFTPSLNHVLARLHNRRSTLIWIEPKTKSAKQLVKKLKNYFSLFVKWLKNSDGEGEALTSSYKMVNPLNDAEFHSSVHVQRFERN